MAGHAVVRRQDGAIFAHLHPAGTFSMAAQEFFVNGKPAKNLPAKLQRGASSAEQQSFGTPLHRSHTNHLDMAEKFPSPTRSPNPDGIASGFKRSARAGF